MIDADDNLTPAETTESAFGVVAERLVKGDVNAFIEYVIKDPHTLKPVLQAELHKSWQAHIDQCWADGVHAGIIAPFGHGKSENVAIGRTLWELSKRPETRIKIVCNTDGNAAARIGAISNYIEHDEALHDVAPSLRPSRTGEWSTHRLQVERRIPSKDASVESWGVMSSGIGGRADIVIFDDVVDLRNAILMPGMRESVKESIMTQWLTRLDQGGRVAYIATPWHKNDATQHFRGNKRFRFLVQKLADDFSCIEESVDGKFIRRLPLWSRKPAEFFKAEMELLSKRLFARCYQDRVLGDGVQTFPSFTACVRPGVRPDVPADWPRFAGVDLSGKERRGNVIFTFALSPDGKRIPLDIVAGLWKSPATAQAIFNQYRKHRHALIFVESNAYQQSLIDWLSVVPGGNELPVQGYATGSAKNSFELGLPSLEMEFERGMWDIHLPQHDAGCQCEWCAWATEMTLHPDVPQTDFTMAMWLARQACKYAQDHRIQEFVPEAIGVSY